MAAVGTGEALRSLQPEPGWDSMTMLHTAVGGTGALKPVTPLPLPVQPCRVHAQWQQAPRCWSRIGATAGSGWGREIASQPRGMNRSGASGWNPAVTAQKRALPRSALSQQLPELLPGIPARRPQPRQRNSEEAGLGGAQRVALPELGTGGTEPRYRHSERAPPVGEHGAARLEVETPPGQWRHITAGQRGPE